MVTVTDLPWSIRENGLRRGHERMEKKRLTSSLHSLVANRIVVRVTTLVATLGRN
jgi:hypothetical protein